MKIWIYAENCVRAGQIAGHDEDGSESSLASRHDLVSWEGSPATIAKLARKRLTRTDWRPGGNADNYTRRTARNVLAYLNALGLLPKK
jgi:hypothetical protein